MLDLFVARQQFGKIKRSTNLADTLAGCRRTGYVVQEVVEEIVDRVPVERLDTLVNDAFDLPVALAEKTLERYRGLQPAILQ